MDQATIKHERKAVLLVDDDPAVLSALRFSLETEGFDVAAFGDGEAALASVRSMPWACVVLDHKLPSYTGLELLSRLRAKGLDAPAIVITSNPSRSLRAKIAAAGAELIEKPLLNDVLNARVRETARAF